LYHVYEKKTHTHTNTKAVQVKDKTIMKSLT